MNNGKRWTLVDAETIERLRQSRPAKTARVLAVTTITIAGTGPLLACNPKGGYDTADKESGDTDTDTDTDSGDSGGTDAAAKKAPKVEAKKVTKKKD